VRKILILGSSGYIGSYLVSSLKKKYNVISHSRKKIINKKFNKNIFKTVTGDVTKKSTLQKVLKLNPDVLIFTISLNHFKSEKNLKISIKNNFEPLKNLVELIIRKKLNVKIIYFSTMQVYGRDYNKKVISEKYPKKINNIYSLTHSMCEELLIKSKNKIKSYSLRLSNSFGMPELKNIDCWWLVLNDFCRSAKKRGEIIIKSDGLALRDFISLKDISRIVDRLIVGNYHLPIINVCSGKTFSIKEIANKVSNNKYFRKRIPVKVLIKKKEKNNKRFKYDNKLIKKIGINSFTNLDFQIKEFLKKI